MANFQGKSKIFPYRVFRGVVRGHSFFTPRAVTDIIAPALLVNERGRYDLCILHDGTSYLE